MKKAINKKESHFHFENVPLAWANERQKQKEILYVVEAINWTLHDPNTVHLIKYFEFGLTAAIARAATLESKEVFEEVIGIRPATEAEAVEHPELN